MLNPLWAASDVVCQHHRGRRIAMTTRRMARCGSVHRQNTGANGYMRRLLLAAGIIATYKTSKYHQSAAQSTVWLSLCHSLRVPPSRLACGRAYPSGRAIKLAILSELHRASNGNVHLCYKSPFAGFMHERLRTIFAACCSKR